MEAEFDWKSYFTTPDLPSNIYYLIPLTNTHKTKTNFSTNGTKTPQTQVRRSKEKQEEKVNIHLL